MADVVEVNCETGEVVEREMTPEELAYQESLNVVPGPSTEELARISAIDKLTALGLTEDEINALLGR